MAADAKTLIIPGHGTVFQAPAATKMPAGGISAFGLSKQPDGWLSLGHTSKKNTVKFKTDGGDATSVDTWLQDGVRTVYKSTAWSLGINGLQIDQPTLDLAFNGEFDTDSGYIVPNINSGLDVALFVLCQDGSAQLGFYLPNTSTKLGDAPETDPETFFELPLNAAVNAADPAAIPALSDGRAGLMKIYKTGLEKPAGKGSGGSH